jgi:outer membrane biosynthesis protein TonB
VPIQRSFFAYLALGSLAVLSLPPLVTTRSPASPVGQDQKKELSGDKSAGSAGMTLEVLTPTPGVDFNEYLHRVYVDVKREWSAVLPSDVERGKKGITVIRFSISHDGKLSKEPPLVVATSSGDKFLDDAAVTAIRSSVPFRELPEAFTGPRLDLRLTFYYNSKPPAP